MAGNNANLNTASKAKQDEFYTQLSDIEFELQHYREHFKSKTVLCNCDDPYESNFFKYFALNFNALGLRKLICTCYAGSPVVYTQLSLFGDEDAVVSVEESEKKPYKIEITAVEDINQDGAVDLTDIRLLLQSVDGKPELLQGDGDFRSPECVELLKEADIVVTNPPFSLFREYIALLMEYDKKFLIIGSQNAVTYKEVFPLIKENRMWLGYHSGHTWFSVPDYYTIPDFYDKSDKSKLRSNGYKIDENGKLWRNLGNICWFTNLDIQKRHEDLILYRQYSPEEYPTYDNYPAIEVGNVNSIPCDYNGVMGVPITFIDKYNPDQFEILGITDRQNTSGLRTKKYTAEDSPKYNDLNARSVLRTETGYRQVYARILIRKRVQ